MSTLALEAGVFGGHALPSPEFLVVVSSTSCYWAEYVVRGYFEIESLFVQ